MFRPVLVLAGLLIVGCASRSPAPSVRGARSVATDTPAPPPVSGAAAVPIDTTSKRPTLPMSVVGTRMAERSLAAGVFGARNNPILTSGPTGQQDYLRRLKCPAGASPWWVRNGSLGSANAAADGHILDVYTVGCPDVMPFLLYMDMYHSGRAMDPIPGMTVLPELPARLATGCPPQMTANADSNATWVFASDEVETMARPIQQLVTTLTGTGASNGTQQVSFIIDTLGVVEPESIRAGAVGAADRFEVVKKVLLALKATPAEHHAGCKVRMGVSTTFRFQ